MSDKIKMRDGDAILIMVKDGKVIHFTPNMSLSHAEFVNRTTRQLPAGAWVGHTASKLDGEVAAMSSKHFFRLPAMMCFVIGLFVLGIPMTDPLLVGFLAFMVPIFTSVFAEGTRFMLHCKIGYDGLRSPTLTFYQRVLRWEDIAVVHGFFIPFYIVRGRFFEGRGQCLLPRPFLLKRPDSLRELIERYAQADNVVRKKLAG